MLNINNKIELCNICKHEHTSNHAEFMPGLKIYVCDNCLEAAKYNFIWICMNCGKVYMRSKAPVIKRSQNYELKRAYALCEDMQIIQGIDMCIECNPEGVLDYVNTQKAAAVC